MDVQQLFLQAVKAALKNEKVSWTFEISPETWNELFSLAKMHHILPMIYEACYECTAAKSIEASQLLSIKSSCLHLIAIQALKTHDFLNLIQFLESRGIRIYVVKGIVCRNLYPNPDYRISSDEDILVDEKQFENCRKALAEYGLNVCSSADDEDEIAYEKKETFTYIELHRQLFPKASQAYGHLNQFFEGFSSYEEKIEGISVYSLEPTAHLFYLICHAFKHFMHSGFGIRQVCDICLYSNAYDSQIDWKQLYEQCKLIHADIFAKALLNIAQKYLTLNADMDACWNELEVDEDALLEDILNAGVFGSSSLSRKHSSTATLNVINGKSMNQSWLRSLFPSRKDMESKYPQLKERPLFLPVAWFDRILHYIKEADTYDQNVLESLNISKQRINLMKQYKIIEKK